MKFNKLCLSLAVAGLFSASAHATLQLTSAYQDAALSVDALGISSGTGQLQADVAAGSTVVQAYLYTSDIFGSGLGPVTFGGSVFAPAGGTLLAPNANAANTVRYDVTSIVAPIINGGAGGIYNFNYNEGNSGLDGAVLVVAYKNASTTGGTAIVLDGELATTGDSFKLNFSSPYTSGNAIMSLASSFSYNGNGTTNATGQVTTVDVSTSSAPGLRRLTSCAGGNDDGGFVAANGMLMTAGGVGDNPTNPDPNCAGGAGDDELYNLALGNSANAAPFITAGDTFVEFTTLNPSNNDNVFGLFFTSTFRITNVNDTPIDNTVPEPGTLALAGLALAGLAARRRRQAK